jgi:catechol 2,3-dioxygenase-like lactoylglutathione lyase family enzyme
VKPRTLDHVALWVAGRDRIAQIATEQLGMHVIERTDRFTLIGADARHGKLTLFEAEGPREPGALRRIGLRVSSLDGRPSHYDLGEGLQVGLVESPSAVEFDLDHVTLVSRDPAAAATAWEAYGLQRVGEARLEVGGAFVDIEGGEPGTTARPLLNHLAVLVDSVEEHVAEAEERGIEIDDVVDAPNTLALFVWGPDRVRLEYVEHKPSFSLS